MTGKGDGSGLSFYGVCVGGRVGNSFLGWRAREKHGFRKQGPGSTIN